MIWKSEISASPHGIKQRMHSLFRAIGIDVRRYRPSTRIECDVRVPLFDEPLEALHYHREGAPAAFPCPVSEMCTPNGFSYGANGWSPLLAAIREYEAIGRLRFEETVLGKFYQRWQPRTALEAIVGFECCDPNILTSLPSHLFYLYPWTSRSPASVDRIVRRWSRSDNLEHGAEADSCDLEQAGFAKHGPVSFELGLRELSRSIGIFEFLKQHGYERKHGDVGVMVLRRGDDMRYLLVGPGYHRVAAMAALDVAYVPATFRTGYADLVDVEDVSSWPQVRSGAWSRRDAVRYIDYLFDFDAREWALTRGLVPRSPPRSEGASERSQQ